MIDPPRPRWPAASRTSPGGVGCGWGGCGKGTRPGGAGGGFLADIEPGGLEGAVDKLAEGSWQESPRMTIEAVVNDRAPVTGINDVVIEKVLTQRLISIEVAVDGERFINYPANGLILPT